MLIVLEIDGLPQPQGNKTGMPITDKATGRTRVVLVEGRRDKSRGAIIEWRRAVADSARAWLRDHPQQPTIDEPVELRVEFRFLRPASAAYRIRHTVKPDASKLVRALEDAIVEAGLLVDDSRISDLHVLKRYGDRPGASVIILPLGVTEAVEREQRKAAQRQRRTDRERRARAATAAAQTTTGGR